MDSFWSYIFQVNLVLSILYLGYFLLLKKLTFFKSVRFYFLGGMFLALIYPFLKIKPVEDINIVLPIAYPSSPVETFNYSEFAIYLTLAVSAFFVVKLFLGLLSIFKIHYNAENKTFKNYIFKNTKVIINPFSFWKWIYLHKNSLNNTQLEQVLKHEYIHTSQRHSFDVLLSEICLIICWYNPLVYFLRKTVKQNLEFLVDAELLNSGIDRISYQHNLVGITTSRFPNQHYGNEFAFTTLKKRIKMMNTEKSSKLKLSSFLVLVPILIFTSALVVSCQKEVLQKQELAISEEIKPEISETPITISRAVTANNGMIDQVKIIVEDKTSNKIIFDAKEFYGLDTNTILKRPTIRVTGNTKKLLDNTLIFLDDIEIESLENIKSEDIESMTVIKNESVKTKYGPKAENGVIKISTKKSDSRQ